MADLLSQNTTLYFGYGSNLWLNQMALRCPHSPYAGLARLPSYRWQINSRGYANVVEVSTPVSGTNEYENIPVSGTESSEYDNVVYGLVYTLPPRDEARLDKNEGVPHAYTKEYIEVDYWASSNTSLPVDTEHTASEKKKMLVYIDRKRVDDDTPKEEYIYRINMGVKDAVKLGVPEGYFEGVVRKFIPEQEEEGEWQGEGREGVRVDGGVRQIALEQAGEFEDGL